MRTVIVVLLILIGVATVIGWLAGSTYQLWSTYFTAVSEATFDGISLFSTIIIRRATKSGLYNGLLMAYLCSFTFTIIYQIYILGQPGRVPSYPTWVVWLWVGYIVGLAWFWFVPTWSVLISSRGASDRSIANLALSIFICLFIYGFEELHLRDLADFHKVDALRKATYTFSGVVETLAIIILTLSALAFNKERWTRTLALSQVGIIILDIVYCSNEFNSIETFDPLWAELTWAALQGITAWILLGYRPADPSPHDRSSGNTTLIVRSPHAVFSMLASGAILLVILYVALTSNHWSVHPILHGEASALCLTFFIIFVVFFMPNLAFGKYEPGGKHEPRVIVINNYNKGNLFQFFADKIDTKE